MLNRAKLFKISIESKQIKITIPISLMIINELLDCLQDLISIATIFVANKNITIKKKKYSLKAMLNMSNNAIKTMTQLKYCKPFDIIDIKRGEDKIKISLR